MKHAFIESFIQQDKSFMEVSKVNKPINPPPGSKLFISSFNRTGKTHPNIASAICVIIRKGQKGKDRIESLNVLLPIFFGEEKEWEAILPIGIKNLVVPSKFVKCDNLMALSPVEFAGWACAQLYYLKKLRQYVNNSSTKIEGIQKNGHPMKIVNNLPNLLNMNTEDFVKILENEEFRLDFIRAKNRQEAIFSKLMIKYYETLTRMEKKAVEFLLLAQAQGANLAKDPIIEATYGYYEDKMQSVEQWALDHGGK